MIGRLGRWCARRAWWVVGVWVVAVAGGTLAAGPLFDRMVDGGLPDTVESIAAYRVLGDAATDDSSGTVVAVVDGVDPSSPAVRSAVTAAAERLAAVPGVREVVDPFDPPVVSSDGRALLLSVRLDAIDGQAARDDATRAIEAAIHEALPDFAVEVGGGPVVNRDIRAGLQGDINRAEYTSLPLTLVVLIFVFGGIVAAGLPVIAAIASVAGAMAVVLGLSYVVDVNQDAVTVVTLFGLGLSIDYGLLLVYRYREELHAGHDAETAILRAWATAGRTVAFSALTVAAALSGLLLFRLAPFTAPGVAGVATAIVAMLVSLTLTAALVGLLRRWIKPRARERSSETGAFARLAAAVQRRPALVAIVTGAILVGAGAPLLTAQLRLPDTSAIPRSIESARVIDTLSTRFGQPAQGPAITVIARTDAATLDAWAARWRGADGVARVNPARDRAAGLASVTIDSSGDPQAGEIRELVTRMRADRPPAAESWVTGNAAVLNDTVDMIAQRMPYALGVTLLAMVVLLFAMTRSVVVPIKAILANLVSLGATFGILTAVFEYGFGSSLLDTITTHALSPFVIVGVFAFAFALSMDYEVFLLGRIKEYVDQGLSTDEAVRRGLQSSGRVITSAALLMVVVFSAFAAGRMSNVEQLGLGLSVAVLIDATIVRCLLVPATMTLLGRWNWWAPRFLSRVPTLEPEGARS